MLIQCLITSAVGTGLFYLLIKVLYGAKPSRFLLLMFFALSFLVQYTVLTMLQNNQVIP